MEIKRIILRCTDLIESVTFWRDRVGLSVVNESKGFAFLDGGSIQLVLNVVPANMITPTLTEIVFEVDDVLGQYSTLNNNGIPFEVEPRVVMEQGGRQLLATHFRDPDGNLASITGWVDPPG